MDHSENVHAVYIYFIRTLQIFPLHTCTLYKGMNKMNGDGLKPMSQHVCYCLETTSWSILVNCSVKLAPYFWSTGKDFTPPSVSDPNNTSTLEVWHVRQSSSFLRRKSSEVVITTKTTKHQTNTVFHNT